MHGACNVCCDVNCDMHHMPKWAFCTVSAHDHNLIAYIFPFINKSRLQGAGIVELPIISAKRLLCFRLMKFKKKPWNHLDWSLHFIVTGLVASAEGLIWREVVKYMRRTRLLELGHIWSIQQYYKMVQPRQNLLVSSGTTIPTTDSNWFKYAP